MVAIPGQTAAAYQPPAAAQGMWRDRHAPSAPVLQQGTIRMTIRGSVDVVTTTEVRGWAYAPWRRETVLVQAVLNHEILGEAAADTYRPDLAAAGLGDGHAGYAIKLFRAIDPVYLPFITVKVDGGDAELPRAPMLGFAEFFTTLFTAHPAAGRSRSVFGGLWTDRTDAAALLRGKTMIGQIDQPNAALIGQLINEGFAIVPLEAPPNEAAWREAQAEQVAETVEQLAMLAMLRAVLEDNPLVLKTEWVADGESALAQPSAANPSPSPAECLAVVVAFGKGVTLNVVRRSHTLPEFTSGGVSRWSSPAASDAAGVLNGSGMLDHYQLEPGRAALIGPGTLRWLRCAPGAAAVQFLCLPCRAMPMTLATEPGRTEVTGNQGALVWT